MDTPIVVALIGIPVVLLGWLIVPRINHHFGTRRERENAIARASEEFLAVTAEQRGKLSTASPRYEIFFRESRPILIRAVHKMQGILPKEQWSRLRDVLTDYESRNENDFHESKILCSAMRIGQNPKAALQSFLDRFDRCIAGPRG